jgi:RNase P protein component
VAAHLQPVDFVVQAQGKLARSDFEHLPSELLQLLRATGG